MKIDEVIAEAEKRVDDATRKARIDRTAAARKPAAAAPVTPSTTDQTTTTGTPATPGKTATGPEAANIVGSNFMKGFAQGIGSDKLAQAANAASGSNISAQAGKDTVPAAAPTQEPAAAPTQEPAAAAPVATPVATPVAAKGKVMVKQDILSWISRNDKDNAALQSFKDGITAAEKAGAAAPASVTSVNYGGKPTSSAPYKVTRTSNTPNAAPKAAAVPAAVPAEVQQESASKQYKKAPL
jgi:hypothetical protein